MKTLLPRSIYTHPYKRLSQTGDTIIEVLIAVAVISLVLTGAYSTTHKSLLATRSSQEHSEAIKLLQGQIDGIRALNIDTTAFPAPPFCLDTTTWKLVSVTTTNCNPTSASGSYNYNISITPTSSNVYNLIATWTSLGGGTSKVDLYYRF